MGIPTRRRDFLQVAAALPAAGVLTATQRAVTASGEPKQADRLVIGLIGCGGRGLQVAGKFQRLPGVELRYVCDVDRARLESAAKSLEVSGSRAASGDMRRLLDDPVARHPPKQIAWHSAHHAPHIPIPPRSANAYRPSGNRPQRPPRRCGPPGGPNAPPNRSPVLPAAANWPRSSTSTKPTSV